MRIVRRIGLVISGVSWFFVTSLAKADVETPVLVPKTGDSAIALDVTVSCGTPDATIRYTTNGTIPTTGDPLVPSNGTIRISRNSVLMAKAWHGGEASSVATEDYRVTGAIDSGYQHGLALSVSGKIWAWGSQGSGRLGNGNTAAGDVLTPGRVLLDSGFFDSGAAISGGYDHSAVIDQNWNVWAFGENADGQLGDNTSNDSAVPVRVMKSATAGDYLGGCVEIDSGDRFSVALTNTGKLYAWGLQSTGRLGNGSTSSSGKRFAVPVKRGDDSSYPDLSGIRAVGIGNSHVLARESHSLEQAGSSGRVWVWGNNPSGQLGLGNTSNASRALLMKLDADTVLTDAFDADAGGNFSAVVRWKESDPDLHGSVWTVGSNSEGRLGVGTMNTPSVSFPARVKKEDGSYLTNIVQVSAGTSHTLARDGDGRVWAWGNNQYGQLGDGTTNHSGFAKMVLDETGSTFLEDIVMVSAGGDGTQGASMALASDGTIYVWGRNDHGQLGTGDTSLAVTLPIAQIQNHVNDGEPSVWLYHSINGPVVPGSVSIRANPAHSGEGGIDLIDRVEIHVDGALLATLTDGNWTTTADNLVAGDHRCIAVAFDTSGKSAMSAPIDFHIFADYGEMGPQPIGSPNPPLLTTPGDFAVGSRHRLAVRWNRVAWGWGSQVDGRLGNGLVDGTAISPTRVVSNSLTPQFSNPVKVAAGDDHSLAIDDAGRVWAFGSNAKNQVGETGNKVINPYLVRTTPGNTTDYLSGATAIAAGTNFSLALGTDGKVRAWGWQNEGRLGDGQTGQYAYRGYALPVKLQDTGNPDLTGIQSISAGAGHALALQGSGSREVYAWGENNNSQLGVGDKLSRYFAVPVKDVTGANLQSVINVSAGLIHSAFVQRTGDYTNFAGQTVEAGIVLCVGSRNYGKLGNNTNATTPEAYPVTVETAASTPLEKIVSVSAGPRHTLAVDIDGNVWAWGFNGSGELGLGDVTLRKRAVKITGLTHIKRVFAGGEDGPGTKLSGKGGVSYAVASDGKIYAWGFNVYGELGVAGNTNVLVPTLMPEFAVGNWQPKAKLAIHQPTPTNFETFSLVASAVDQDGPSDIASVSFFKGTTLLQTLTNPSPWIIDGATLANGQHNDLKVVVTDRSGATAESAPIAFDKPLKKRQALSGPFSDWDSDGLADAADDGGVENWANAVINAGLADPDGAGDGLGALDDKGNLIGYWDFEKGPIPTGSGNEKLVTMPAKKGNADPLEFKFNESPPAGTPDYGIVWDLVNAAAPVYNGMPSAGITFSRPEAVATFKPANFSGKNSQTWSMFIKFPPDALKAQMVYKTLFAEGLTAGTTKPDLHCYFDLSVKMLKFDSYTVPSHVGTRMPLAQLEIPDSLDDGKWHHLAVGFGTSLHGSGYKLWLDGKVASYSTAPPPTIGNAIAGAFVAMGKSQPGFGDYLDFGSGQPGQGKLEATIDRLRINHAFVELNDQIAALCHQDIDRDGIWDLNERRGYIWRDTNSDGLRDIGEADFDPYYWTNPLLDPDNDGLTMLQEQAWGTDPYDADSDNDGLKDGFEVTYELKPMDPSDGPLDSDEDSLTNVQEAYYGTNPKNKDTDGDGVWDDIEVARGTDPLNNRNYPLTDGGLANLTPPGFDPASLTAIAPLGTLGDPSFASDPPPNAPTNEVQVRIGDPSDSASEDWSLWLGKNEVRGRRVTDPPVQTVKVDRRKWLPITLSHLGTSYPPTGPDYDYLATVNTPDRTAFVVFDGDPTDYDGDLGGYKGRLLKKFSEDGQTTDTSWQDKTAYLVPIEKQSFSRQLSISGNDTAGPKYRKVGLDGRPLADEKPEEKDESDHESEETYVDAYDLALRHDTSFVYVPLAASDLKLQVTASLTETMWTDRSGLAPYESMTLPFGACWSSNLCSYVEVIESIGGGSADPITVNVVDEDGHSQRFTCNGPNQFIPWPSSRTNKKSLLNTLTRTGDGGFEYKKRFGTVLNFEPTLAYFAYSSDRLKVNSSGKRHSYWRLKTVTDRFNTHLNYEYGNNPAEGTLSADSFTTAQLAVALIPGKIYSPDRLGQQIIVKRSPNLRRVEGISDPRHAITRFEYDPVTFATCSSGADLPVNSTPPGSSAHTTVPLKLKEVFFPDGTSEKYTYQIADGGQDLETRRIVSGTGTQWRFTDYFHLNLVELINRRQKKYSFTYDLNNYTRSYAEDQSSDGYYAAAVNLDGLPAEAVSFVQGKLKGLNHGPAAADVNSTQTTVVHGLPRLVKTVQAPDAATAQFIRNPQALPVSAAPVADDSYVMFLPDANGKPSYSANIATKVIDAEGGITKYAFTGLRGELVNINMESSYQGGTSMSSSAGYEWMLYYTGLQISYCDKLNVSLGSETYAFDLESGLELSSVTDFSGNKTEWLFDQSTPLPAGTVAGIQGLSVNGKSFLSRYPEPYRKKEALTSGGQQRFENFHYDDVSRRMDHHVDGHGTVTDVVFNDDDLPISRTVSDASGVLQLETFAYNDSRFPGFMTRKTVESLGGTAAPLWETDLVTAYEADSFGRVKYEIVDPDGLHLVTEYGYDDNGNKTTVKDPRGFVSKFYFDAMNRIYQVDRPIGTDPSQTTKAIEYKYYDKNGALAAVKDANQHWTVFVRDDRGRKIAKVIPMTATLAPQANASGIISDVDLASLLVSAQTGSPSPHLIEETAYNKVSSVTSKRNARGTSNYTYYDALQRPVHAFAGFTSTSLPTDLADATLRASQSDSISHTEFQYLATLPGSSLAANPGGCAFNSDGFKPTVSIRHNAVRESGTTSSSLTTYARYDAVYRPVYLSEQYSAAATGFDDGWKTSTTVYGPPFITGGDYREPSVVTVTDDLSMVTETISDGLGRTTSVTTAKGTTQQRTASTNYSGTGLAWKTIDALNRTTQTTFDAAGRPTRVDQPDPDTGGITANSPFTVTQYDANGNAEYVTNPLGFTSQSYFDGQNRVFKTESQVIKNGVATGWVRNWTYFDPAGNVVKKTDPRGASAVTFYDFANRAVETRTNPVTGAPSEILGTPNANDVRQQSILDNGGLVLHSIDGNGNRTSNAYDSLGRLTVTVTDPEDGLPPDPNGAGFDPADHRGLSGMAMVVTNAYDDAGNLIEVADGKGQRTGFRYDGFARKVATIWDPGTTVAKTETLSYDGLQIRKRTDASSRKTIYRYDALHRLSETIYDPVGATEASPHADNLLRSYDAADRLLSVSHPNDTSLRSTLRDVVYTYDYLDRLTSEKSAGVIHTYPNYDKAGNRKETVYGGTNRTLLSTYDSLNRLVDCEERAADYPTSGSRHTGYEYDLAGNVTRKDLPNGNYTTTTYDYAGRKLVITERKGTAGNDVVVKFDYSQPIGIWPSSYDGAGNVLQVFEGYGMAGCNSKSVLNEYDKANRLTLETRSEFVPDAQYPVVRTEKKFTSYSYDRANNRGLKLEASAWFRPGYSYEGEIYPGVGWGPSPWTGLRYVHGDGANGYNSNQLMRIETAGSQVGDGISAIRSFEYDANGNRTFDYNGPSGGTARTLLSELHFDHENRLRTFHSVANGDSAYEYDYRSRRVVRDDAWAPNVVVSSKVSFSGGVSVQEWNLSGQLLNSEIIRGSDWGGGVGGILYSVRNGARSYNGYNSRGDVVSTTAENGSATWQAAYEAFGKRTKEDGTTPVDRQRANTKEEDPTGLLNEGMRYRDLETGVFISRDPAGFVDGPNVYTYVQQNPWTKFDPDGLSADSYCDYVAMKITTEQGAREQEQTAKKVLPVVAAIGVTVLTDGAAAPLVASLGWEGPAVATGVAMLSGGTGSVAGKMTSNKMEGRPLMQGTPQAGLIGAAAGGVAQTGVNIFRAFVQGYTGAAAAGAEGLAPSASGTLQATTAETNAAGTSGASFGTSTSTNYRRTFFDANPGLEGEVVVHHAVEQQTLTRYPGTLAEAQIHSLENLRGIPKAINSDVHLSKIRKSWNEFYRTNPSPTEQQFLDHATAIDDQFGHLFNPPVR